MKKILIMAAFCMLATLAVAQGKDNNKASIQLIRNATLIIQYGNYKILVDPMLSKKGAIESWAGIARNPMVDLKMPIKSILSELDLVLVSHTHADHFDQAAISSLDKSLKIINQPADSSFFKLYGYRNAQTLKTKTIWNRISIERIDGEHGSGKVLEIMGKTSGFVLSSDQLPKIYIMGDAIWNDRIKKEIERIHPDVIVVNSGGARVPGFEQSPIIMDEKQTMELIAASGNAKVIAVHMDALDHCRTTRAILRKEAKDHHIGTEKLAILEDAQVIELSK